MHAVVWALHMLQWALTQKLRDGTSHDYDMLLQLVSCYYILYLITSVNYPIFLMNQSKKSQEEKLLVEKLKCILECLYLIP